MSTKCLAILSCMLLLLPFASCRHDHGDDVKRKGVEINTDSLFIDLGKGKVTRRAKMADAAFEEICATSGLNGVVLYAEQGQVLYRHAFGWRDLRHRRDSLRIDDQFQLSSDSKMFTAEAIMLLHMRGKIDYDADVREYIPEFPYSGITVRNLLNHRSGLSRYEVVADEFWPDRNVPLSNEDMIKLLVEKKPEPYSPPDVIFHYNNINYALLATIVERITGKHFEDFMRDNIFEPLGMHRSYIYSMRGDTVVSTFMDCDVPGHDMFRNGGQTAQNDYLNGVMGDKIMFSTVDDIYRFCVALNYDLLLPDSIQSEAFRPGSPTWWHEENYGFGWRLHQQHPGTVYHFGWWKGYRSYIIRYVDKNRVLIVLTNTDRGTSGEALWNFINDTTLQLPQADVNVSQWKSDNGIKTDFMPK